MPKITNLGFLPGLFAMFTWAFLIGLAHLIVEGSPFLGFFFVPVVAVVTFVWAFRARHNFGRTVSRGHFDEIDLLQLPPRSGDVDLWDPPTQVERTKEEQTEETELNKELSKAFQEGYEDTNEYKQLEPAPVDKDKPVKKSKKKIHGKLLNEFRKKPEAHYIYSNEFQFAKQSASDDFKKKQEAHYANEFLLVKKMLEKQENEDNKDKIDEDIKEDEELL